MKKVKIWLALADEDPHSLMVIQSALEEKGMSITAEDPFLKNTGKRFSQDGWVTGMARMEKKKRPGRA